jgi:hypothetical protein
MLSESDRRGDEEKIGYLCKHVGRTSRRTCVPLISDRGSPISEVPRLSRRALATPPTMGSVWNPIGMVVQRAMWVEFEFFLRGWMSRLIQFVGGTRSYDAHCTVFMCNLYFIFHLLKND